MGITVLHNLALAVLANALDVNSNEDIDAASSPEDVPAVRDRLDTSESISEQFLDDSLEFSENREIMKTLISELGKAGMKPHNACLSGLRKGTKEGRRTRGQGRCAGCSRSRNAYALQAPMRVLQAHVVSDPTKQWRVSAGSPGIVPR